MVVGVADPADRHRIQIELTPTVDHGDGDAPNPASALPIDRDPLRTVDSQPLHTARRTVHEGRRDARHVCQVPSSAAAAG